MLSGAQGQNLTGFIAFDRWLVPDAGVKAIASILASYLSDGKINPSTEEYAAAQNDSLLSVLNFPPQEWPTGFQNEAHTSGRFLLHNEFLRRAVDCSEKNALDFLHSFSIGTGGHRDVLTYAEIDIMSTSLADELLCILRQRGPPKYPAGPSSDHIIPVYMSTCPELYISYLAILKAGWAFCPLPLDAPAQRLNDILHDIEPTVVMGRGKESEAAEWSEASKPWLPAWIDVSEICSTRGSSARCRPSLHTNEKCREHLKLNEASPTDLAYVLYTSGSTGRPKGVQITHLAATCSISSHIHIASSNTRYTSQSRWFQFAAPTFDPSIMEIFVTLSTGATLCSSTRELMLSDTEATITSSEATIMMATPSLASLLRPANVPTLQDIWTMGEKLNHKVIRNFAKGEVGLFGKPTRMDQLSNHKSLTNAYGPTEGTINCTLLPDLSRNVRGSIIGQPLPTCSIFIINPRTESIKPVPAGFVGELAIGGPQISIGYLNRPEQNTVAFVKSTRYGRLYRTGDKARIVWNTQGQPMLEFLGRLGDDQVKINGQRVELGEIETILSKVEGVYEVVVIFCRPKEQTSQLIIAFIVAEASFREEATIRVEKDCRTAIIANLPRYMHPSNYIFVTEVPRSTSGKIERRTLISIAETELLSQARNQWSEPNQLTDVSRLRQGAEGEQAIEHVLKRALKKVWPRTGGEDFLQPSNLGRNMDSLTSMFFLQAIRDEGIGVLCLQDILAAQSITQLSNLILHRDSSASVGVANTLAGSSRSVLRDSLGKFRRQWTSTCSTEIGVPTSDIKDVLPTTVVQSRILLSFQNSSMRSSTHNKPYVNHSVFRTKPEVSTDKLTQAWTEVLQSYDIFRAVFVQVDDDLSPFAQCILHAESSKSRIRWQIFHAETDDDSEFEAVTRKAVKEAQSKIGKTCPPMVMSLIRSARRSVIMISMMHAVFDFGSLRLLTQAVEAKYSCLPSPTYTDIYEAVISHFSRNVEDTDEKWSQYLEGFSPSPFATLSGLREEAFSITTRSVLLQSATNLKKLQYRSHMLRCSPLAVLQAAWSSVLMCYSGAQTRDVVFGNVLAGRNDKETEMCIAPTFTIVPTRVQAYKPDGQTAYTNEQLLHHLTTDNAEASKYLFPKLGSTTRIGSQRSYDTLLAFQVFGTTNQTNGIFDLVESLPMAHDFALMVEVWPGKEGLLQLKVTFTDQYLDEQAAFIMLEEFSDLLNWILENPTYLFMEACMNVRQDLQSVCGQGIDQNLAEHGDSPYLQNQFETMATLKPDNLALIFFKDMNTCSQRNVHLTYGELNRTANDLSDYLSQVYGSLNGIVVPILMNKSPELYVAVLGVLKAGGAWCPIDTASPAQRRHELITRTGAGLLLVDRDVSEFDPEGVPSSVIVLNVTNMSQPPKPFQRRMVAIQSRTSDTSHIAYLIWTSGTTGSPKGVSVSHKAAVTSMKALQRMIPPTTRRGDPLRCMQFSQHTFDVFVQDLFYTWGMGGTLVSATRDLMVDSFPEITTLSGATHAHLTPAFAAGISRNSCPTLEVVTMIGEKLPQHVADDWGDNMRAFNTYGPAEATVVSTLKEFKGKGERHRSSNIGLPLPSVSCSVLRNEQIVMKGGVGELALGGLQTAEGYLDDPWRTTEKFIWHEGLGERIYMTGDIVRLLADNTLDFIGREDDLVKLNGIRVELSEITFALRDCHPKAGQIETCYICRSDRPSQVVVSFIAAERIEAEDLQSVVLTGDRAAEIAATALHVARSKLPDFMVPKVFIILSTIPRTPSAKVDRKALSAAYENLDLDAWESKMNPNTMDSENVSEWTNQEQGVLDAISSLSQVSIESISRVSYLPALGVDSITAGRLAIRLRDRGIYLATIDILRSRTVRNLLEAIANVNTAARDAHDLKFDIVGFHNKWQGLVRQYRSNGTYFILPASMIQEGLIIESMTSSDSYWSSHFFDIAPSTNLDRLKCAWQAVSDKNEALRTSFLAVAEIDGSLSPDGWAPAFLQLVHDQMNIQWSVIKSTQTGLREDAKARAQEIALQHQQESFSACPWAITIFSDNGMLVMSFTIHHALHDAVSADLILQDVWSAYHDGVATLPRRHQLRDCSTFQVDISSEGHNENTKYWTQQLKDVTNPDSLSWPDLSVNRQALKDDSSTLLSLKFPLEVSNSRLEEAATTLSVSPAAIIRAVWSLLLTRYLEAPVVVFGEVVSERVFYPDLDDAIAPLISVIPVPFRPQDTFRQTLREQSKLVLSARDHRRVPATLVRQLIGRPNDVPLYPAILVFHMVATKSSPGCNKDWWKELNDMVGLKVEHPLALNVYNDGGWSFEIFADANYMGPEHLDLISGQLNALIHTMIGSPDGEIAKLVSSLPQDTISISKCSLPATTSHQATINPTHWVGFHADQHPNWIAVEVVQGILGIETSTETWTFQVLDQESNKIASYIQLAGYHDKVIAMCTGRTLKSYAVILGILKSGNTYLPIDDALPQDRKTLLLADSQCVMLFTDNQCVSSFPESQETCTLVSLDDSKTFGKLDLLNSTRRITAPSPDQSAYLLYTSGSTGKPKGVLISLKNLCGFIEGLAAYIGLCLPATHQRGGIGKFLGLASRAFDVHLCEMFLGWRLGLSAVTAPREALLDDLRLALITLKVTHACFVPSLLDQAGIEPQSVPDLVYFSVGGEKISKRILDTWASQEHTLVVNAYGPTEAAIGCCASRISPKSNPRNIGAPFGNTQAHVLVPGTFDYTIRGQSGELCITGDLVGNGYFQRPDAKGFVDDFYGKRMYRTGDIVRMMVDGSLEYLGRSDDQTKIRGQRVELGEVSETIRASSLEKVDVATLLLQHPSLPKPQLTSFVAQATERTKRYSARPTILDQSQREWANSLQEECQRRLPAYMVPDCILATDVIPLAPISGKADAKMLKIFFASLPVATLLLSSKASKDATTIERPLTEREKLVLATVRKITNTDAEQAAHRTSIFELGLDSLSAIGLSTRLRKLGFECTVATILSRSSVEELASLPDSGSVDLAAVQFKKFDELLAEFDRNNRTMLFKENNAADVEKVRPCLPLQEGTIARTITSDTKNLYINHVVLRLSDDLDLKKLKTVWYDIFRDTPILRTCFIQVDGQILQVIKTSSSITLPWKECSFETDQDLVRVSYQQQTTEASDIIQHIESIPPVRFSLLRSKSQPPLLSISIHHALYDGESWGLILNEVYSRYSGRPSIRRTPFHALLGYTLSQEESKQESFWSRYLQDCRSSNLARENENIQRPEDVNTQGLEVTKTLTLDLPKLRVLASEHKATLPTLLQSIFGTVLAREVNSNDVVFGLLLSGRSVPVHGAETILGPCITTIPQRMRFSSANTELQRVITDTQQSVGECLVFQHTSLRKINRWAGLDRPLFDCLFSYVDSYEKPQYEDAWSEVESFMPPDYPFAIEFEPDNVTGKLVARCVFTSAFGPSERAEAMLERLDIIVSALSRRESVTVGSLGIVVDGNQSEGPNDNSWDETNWTREENLMRTVVVRACGIDGSLVTKNASFFRLGIDSVSAIHFAQKLREVNFNVRSSDIMRYSCIGAFSKHLSSKIDSRQADLINQKNKESRLPHDLGIGFPLLAEDDTIDALYPCVPLQSGMITKTLASSGDLYVHHHALRLSYGIEASKLQEAWDIVVNTNDILRTSFHFAPQADVTWVAAVHKTFPIRWTETAFGGSIDQFLETLSRRMVYRKEVAFERPPHQVNLVACGADRFFIISMHHALYDGLSVPLILDALTIAYKQGKGLDRPSFQAASNLITAQQSTSINFWARQLHAYQAVELQKHQTDDPVDMIITEKPIASNISRVLRGCKEMDVTLQAVCLLAFSKVLSCLLERRDIVFGHVVAGRSLPIECCENIIGPLFNTVPFRLKLDQSLKSNQDVVKDIQNFSSEAQEHQHAPLQYVQNAWRRGGSSGISKLFDTLFLFQKASSKQSQDDALWEPVASGGDIVKSEYGLNFEIEQSSEQILVHASCHNDCLTEEGLSALVSQFEETFAEIINHPGNYVTTFPKELSTVPHMLQETSPIQAKERQGSEDIETGPEVETIRQILADISGLSLENIGSDTSIYAIGLDSIVAIKVASVCRKQGLNLHVSDILRGETPAGVSRLLGSQSDIANVVSTDVALTLKDLNLPWLDSESVEIVLPCLSGQTYHLIGWLNSARTLYEPTFAYIAQSKLNADRLASVWNQLQAHNSVIRTIFTSLSSTEAAQIVLKPCTQGSGSFKRIQSGQDFQGFIKDLVRSEANRPSDQFSPPVNICLVQGIDHDAILLKIHHAAYDAWSIPLLISNLCALYQDEPLETLPGFSDFVQHTLQSLASLDQKQYWQKSLRDHQKTYVGSTVYSQDIQRNSSFNTISQSFISLPNLIHLTPNISSLCSRLHLTFPPLLLVAFSRLLARKTNTENPLFGHYAVGRSSSFPSADRVPGPCLNVQPLVVRNPLRTRPLDTANTIRKELAERTPYEQSSLTSILEWVGAKEEPIFNAYINVLWHRERMGTAVNHDTDRVTDDDKPPLLKLLDLGPPTDFLPSTPLPGKTAVDGLEWKNVAKEGLYVDVALRTDGGGVDVAGRCEGTLMGEELEGWLREFGDEVGGVLEELKEDEAGLKVGLE